MHHGDQPKDVVTIVLTYLYATVQAQHLHPAAVLPAVPAGPTGKILLLPQDPSTNLIMVATGSGIAPYRTFWRRLFVEDVPSYKFTGELATIAKNL